MFLGLQLLEKRFEQPRMTGRRDRTQLSGLIDALHKRPGQAELDELGPGPLPFLISGGDGTTLFDEGLEAALVSRR